MEAAHFPKEPAHTGLLNHTRSIAEKEKEYTESHKIDKLYEFSNDSSRDRTTCPAVFLYVR